VESSSPRKQILIAHAIGTLSTNETILDDDMALPPKWDDLSTPQDGKLGHKPEGKTAMLHSLAVLPGYQGQRVGSTMLKGYIDLVRGIGAYDRLALIADKSHVDYYSKRGFTNLGPSKATFGGEEWFDMVGLTLSNPVIRSARRAGRNSGQDMADLLLR
jgi:GNAT superfamily N-acetyltransferase